MTQLNDELPKVAFIKLNDLEEQKLWVGFKEAIGKRSDATKVTKILWQEYIDHNRIVPAEEV